MYLGNKEDIGDLSENNFIGSVRVKSRLLVGELVVRKVRSQVQITCFRSLVI